MKLAVISDIHGNLEAFSAVLEEMRQIRPHTIISLGDNIGYGPDSEAVMGLMAAYGIESVLGNHEMVVKNPKTMRWFNPMAQKALNITLSQLSPDSVRRIRTYPAFLVREGIRFVHGAPPVSPFLYLFQLTEDRLAQKMERMKQAICFAGHTHDLGMTTWDRQQLVLGKLMPGACCLDPGKKYLINAGSVGQPRDGTPRAKFIIYDTVSREMAVHATAYPFKKTQEKIIAAGIPEMYAAKLALEFDS